MLVMNHLLHLVVVLGFFSGISSWKIKSKRSFDSSNWMKDNMGLLGKRTLKQICLPGSHDAGMSEFLSGTALAHPCNVLTQSAPIRDQLANGVRYFDIRPVIGNSGRYLTGHYSKLPGGSWQGGNGQTMESIVADINQFIKSRKELVIVKLSHTLNTDLGNTKYRTFNQQEWDRLFDILDKTYSLYYNSDPKVYLPSLTLNQFTDGGRRGAVVYIVSDSGINLGSRLGKGYFYHSNINTYDEYSNTNKVADMMVDQLKKMKEHSRNSYFLLSWTLTQGVKHVSLCRLKLAKSIRDLAVDAHLRLKDLMTQISPSSFPNVLYLDDIKNSYITEVAMDVNRKLLV